MRAHVVLPEELVREVDRLTGPRKRSQFIEDAVRMKLQLAKQGEALKKALYEDEQERDAEAAR